MRVFVKSVVTGFAFSLGAALFRKIAPKLGLQEEDDDRRGKNGETKAAEGAQAEEPLRAEAAVEDDGDEGSAKPRMIRPPGFRRS